MTGNSITISLYFEQINTEFIFVIPHVLVITFEFLYQVRPHTCKVGQPFHESFTNQAKRVVFLSEEQEM